ncbi:hypothetical protein ASPTUDRAFT_843205 [Aspergillus tubingensis CBS 134.48]|uniref:Uncharacterized protein n=1 Tax=Aspergillus tubingensis (strain CBS 134.48) TaxID=767770 RepID=A0A1L9MT11_ASPTC|nr:hypothetical protein ASPTUDRAFT_843205 [Aspergillus tubingensis CBS 134.48]
MINPVTLPIYTHLIPALILLLASLTTSPPIPDLLPPLPPTPQSLLHLTTHTATLTLLLSTLYHVHQHKSPQPSSTLYLRLDQLGIILLIVVNSITGIYFGFYEDTPIRDGYMVLILSLSIFPITTHLLLPSRYTSSPEYNTLRIISLLLPALSAVIPIFHGYLLHGGEYLLSVGVGWYVSEGVVVLFGVCVYLMRFPERWYTSLWTEVCTSHVVWHVCVVVGIGFHIMGVRQAVRFWFE